MARTAPLRLLRLIAKATHGLLIVPEASLSVRSWRVALGRCDGAGRLWLFTRSDESLVEVLARRPQVCVTMHGIQASAAIVGRAAHVTDPRQVAALWSGEVDRSVLGLARDSSQPEPPFSPSPLLLRVDPLRVDVWERDRRDTFRQAFVAVRRVLERGESAHT